MLETSQHSELLEPQHDSIKEDLLSPRLLKIHGYKNPL